LKYCTRNSSKEEEQFEKSDRVKSANECRRLKRKREEEIYKQEKNTEKTRRKKIG